MDTDDLQWQDGGTNLEFAIDGKILYTRCDLAKRAGLSSTGKNDLISKSGGPIEIKTGTGVRLNFNLYTPRGKGR